MQRVIKFRAWDKKNKAMLPIDRIGFKLGGEVAGITYFESEIDEITLHSHEFELMQFTGLTDKNGLEIFEGDIIKYKPYYNLGHRDNYENGKIEWGQTGDSDGYSHAKHYEWIINEDSLADIADSDYPEEASCEIIGNIYESPDLLTKS